MNYLKNNFGFPDYAYAVYDGKPTMNNYLGHISNDEYLKRTQNSYYQFNLSNGEKYFTDRYGLTKSGKVILDHIESNNLTFKRIKL